MSTALTHARSVQQTAANGRVSIEPNPRRIRVFFAGRVVADTTRALYLFEQQKLPVYYLPRADVRTEFLVPVEYTTYCPWKGTAVYWDLVVGERRSEHAVWGYPEPLEDALDIRDYVAFYWNRVDAWFEEDEQVFVHPRDPYVRVDVLESSRHIEVFIGEQLVADTVKPRLLFETSLPTRYYIPRIDVRAELFTPSDTITACPYKGTASHMSYVGEDEPVEDVAWYYPHTTKEASGIDNHWAFYPHRVGQILVDGVPLER